MTKLKKEIIKFSGTSFNNRWRQKRYMRNCDWVFIGISENWFGPEMFCYRISFFGLDLNIWFARKFIY